MDHKRIIIGAALMALASCGQSGNQAEQRAKTQPANIVITSPEGNAQVRIGGGGGALTGLPEGIPAYPGADTTASIDVSGGEAGNQGRILGFRTTDTPAQVIAFYTQAVTGAGYRVASQMNMGPTAMIVATRAEGEGVTVSATQSGGATQVQIIAGAGNRR